MEAFVPLLVILAFFYLPVSRCFGGSSSDLWPVDLCGCLISPVKSDVPFRPDSRIPPLQRFFRGPRSPPSLRIELSPPSFLVVEALIGAERECYVPPVHRPNSDNVFFFLSLCRSLFPLFFPVKKSGSWSSLPRILEPFSHSFDHLSPSALLSTLVACFLRSFFILSLSGLKHLCCSFKPPSLFGPPFSPTRRRSFHLRSQISGSLRWILPSILPIYLPSSHKLGRRPVSRNDPSGHSMVLLNDTIPFSHDDIFMTSAPLSS